MLKSRMTGLVLLFALSAGSVSAQAFGGPLAVSGDQVLIGEARNGNLPGIVYLYRAQASGWTEVAQLAATDGVGPPDGFGRAVATHHGSLLVGAPLEANGSGAVYVYATDGDGGWAYRDRLRTEDGDTAVAFGSAIAVAEHVAVIAAPEDGAGAVYVFRRTADGRYEPGQRLRVPDGHTGTRFGSSLVTDGRTLLVSTAQSRDAPGSVHAFRLVDDRWTHRGVLEAEGLGERSGYGSTLGLRDGRAYVGAPGAAQRAGAVIVFSYDETERGWTAESRLGPFVARPNTRFGSSIAFEGSEIWIGAPGDASGAGALYVFAADWSGAVRRTSALGSSAAFASTVAMAGDIAVVGAAGIDSRAGGAVMLTRSGGDWIEGNLVVPEMRGPPAITGAEVPCADNAASGFRCNEVNIVSFLPIKDIGGGRGTSVNDIWGWTDPETGREYAIVGRTDGTSFVDISDPHRPEYLGDLPKTEGSRSSIWRDMKVYRDHVYIVADAANEHGVQVFDLRQLRTLRNPPVAFEPTFVYDGIHSAHNIVINEATGFAYSVGSSSGGETCGGGLHMINLENPARPTFAGCFADPSTGRRKTGYSHDAQCVAYHGPDTDHRGKEICLGSNETALNIADVTDKTNPMTIATISYPNVAYTHQGWLTEDHRYFYQNDEGDEPQGLVAGTRTLVWDVTDLDDPVLVKEHVASTPETDHNLYVRGNLMFQSNYGAGLRVLDVSDPANPVEIGFLDTTPYGGGGSWSNYPYFESGLVIATSMGEGLFVLKATGRPRLVP